MRLTEFAGVRIPLGLRGVLVAGVVLALAGVSMWRLFFNGYGRLRGDRRCPIDSVIRTRLKSRLLVTLHKFRPKPSSTAISTSQS